MKNGINDNFDTTEQTARGREVVGIAHRQLHLVNGRGKVQLIVRHSSVAAFTEHRGCGSEQLVAHRVTQPSNKGCIVRASVAQCGR